ncbi:MAG: molybdenum cofactor guanylyltransferase [Bacillota bacterium]|nr:molybdenum cofactor guanylyltransferase [Bacillota bacterium]MDW7683078.1 molybdenum cofactor guanylyltransferase [Bacillota bacterium]
MQPKEMSAVILAGGKSSRMGENKLLMPLGEKPVIGHLTDTLKNLFGECIMVTDTPDAYVSFPVRVVQDKICCAQKNSLAGIHAGLVAATHDYIMVVAGDMPFVRDDVLSYLCNKCEGYDVTIPREGEYLQPLCAVYHKNCLPQMEKLLTVKNYKVTAFFPFMRVRYVDMADLVPFDREQLTFLNINTPEDYKKALAVLAKSVKGGL